MSTIDTTSSRTLMNTANNIHLTRLLQFTDSTCPIGAFTFSCGLESAVANGIVHNSDTLKEYVRANAVQAAYCDAIAAIHAHRAAAEDNYGMILQADKELLMVKMNDESRSMLRKMGRKFAELFNSITPTPVSMQLIDSIRNNDTPGCYPAVQGVCFASIGINEHELFISHQYGVINMVLSAALRCVKVSHIDTQKILFELMEEATLLYDDVSSHRLDEMHCFCPELDLMASIHEKGNMRMFMS